MNESTPSGKDVMLKVVKGYGNGDVANVLADMSDRGWELDTAYHVTGQGHYLYFCRYYALEDTSKRIIGQTQRIPDRAHTTRNKARPNKI